MGIQEEAENARAQGLAIWREKMCYLYTAAHDRGDLDALATLWQLAEQDSELCEMFVEIDNALHDEMLAEQGETPAQYTARLATMARSLQSEIEVIMSLRLAGQGQCLCGAQGNLYTLASAPPPARRCVACWKEYSAATRKE